MKLIYIGGIAINPDNVASVHPTDYMGKETAEIRMVGGGKISARDTVKKVVETLESSTVETPESPT